MSDYKKLLIILIEVKAREFDSRLLIASKALDAGFRVVFGEKNSILRSAKLKLIPKGIILDKCAQPESLSTIRKLKKLGFKYTSIDEEAIAISDEEDFAKTRYSIDTIENSDIIFTWGAKHDKIMKNFYPNNFSNTKFKTTGNPRITLLSESYEKLYENEINEIKKKYHGKIILIPSNFSFYTFNSKISYRDYIEKSNIVIEDLEGMIDTYKKNYYAFIELLDKLSKNFPKNSFIFRPHPTDKKNKLVQDTKKFKNVFVNNSFGIIPWLHASDMLIHLGCTTAIEMYQLSKPIISYENYFNKKHRNALPNFMSKRFINKTDVIRFVSDYFEKNHTIDDRINLKRAMNDNLFYESHNSHELIISSLKNIEIEKTQISSLKSLFIKPILFCISVITDIKLMIIYRNTFKNYFRQKFDNISTKEVDKKLHLIDKELCFQLKKINKKIIIIENAHA